MNVILTYRLIKTTRRLTFDIISQDAKVTYLGDDDGPYYKFIASNGYEVISRSRMDIQTERLWLQGAKFSSDPRSGTMVFSSDAKRDAAYEKFEEAINEWATANGGVAVNLETPTRVTQSHPAAVAEPSTDFTPPANCRQRLMAEGKPYPRSSCAVCGPFSPNYEKCNTLIHVTECVKPK